MKIIIIGGGQVGTYIASLLEKNHEVKVIENRLKAIESFSKNDFAAKMLITGDGTDIDVLEKAGIKDCDILVCVTGHDEINLTAAMIGKFEYDVNKIIARVNNPKNSWLFNQGMGVDVKINQADIIGHLIADEMNYQSLMTLVKLAKGDYSIVKIRVDYKSNYINSKISEIKMPDNALLIAIYQQDNLLIPRGDTIITAGQNILVFGDDKAIKQLYQYFS